MAALTPALVQPLIAEYRARLERDTFASVAGIYLVGSIALGAFDPARSDIDFVTLLSRPAAPSELAALSAVHEALARRFPRWRMEGSYVQIEDLAAPLPDVPPCPAYYSGGFHVRARHDLNPVTWWLLRNHGVPHFGPDPSDLPFDVDWETVRAYITQNLSAYWGKWAYDPRRMALLLADEGVEWAVLGILRLRYALDANEMISKVGAGDYALRTVSTEWHQLIREALRIRRGAGAPLYRTRVGRAIDAVRFLRCVIREGTAAPPLMLMDGRPHR